MNEQTRIRVPERATYADVLAAPEGMTAEVLGGMLHLQPQPRLKHMRVSTMLTYELEGPFGRGRGGPGGWWIMVEPEIHLDDDILVPDLAGWRRETWAAGPQDEAYATIAPDWVCEILSPSTRRHDLTIKRDIYGANGVSHLWFVDPEALTLEAFALVEGHWTLIAALGDDAQVRVPPFDAVAFPLSELWVHQPDDAA